MVKVIFRILRENAGIVLGGLAIEGILLSFFLQTEIEETLARWAIVSPLAANGEAAPGQLLLALIPYWFAYRVFRDKRRRGDVAIAAAFSGIFAVTLLARVFPMSSDDIYLYAFFGHVGRYFGAHPYDAVAATFPDHAFVGAMGSWLASLKNTYGPLWTGIVTAVTAVAGRGLAANAIAIKAVTTVFLFGTVFLLTRLEDVAGKGRGERPAATFVLLAWNPVVLFEFVQAGHNDIAMLFFLVLAFYLASRRRPWATGAALAASASIKYVTVLCVPFFALYFLFGTSDGRLRRKFRDAASLVLAFAALVAAFFFPYWQGMRTLDGLRAQAGLFAVASLGPVPYVMALIARGGSLVPGSFEPIVKSVESASRVLAFGVVVGSFIAACRRLRLRDVAAFSVIVLGAYLCMASFWVMPWYLLWFAPLFVLLGMRPELLLCSVLVMMTYGFSSGDVMLSGIVGLAVVAWVRRSRERGTLPAALAIYFEEPSPARP